MHAATDGIMYSIITGRRNAASVMRQCTKSRKRKLLSRNEDTCSMSLDLDDRPGAVAMSGGGTSRTRDSVGPEDEREAFLRERFVCIFYRTSRQAGCMLSVMKPLLVVGGY